MSTRIVIRPQFVNCLDTNYRIQTVTLLCLEKFFTKIVFDYHY